MAMVERHTPGGDERTVRQAQGMEENHTLSRDEEAMKGECNKDGRLRGSTHILEMRSQPKVSRTSTDNDGEAHTNWR